jgi:hypothetical protein
MMPSNNVSVTEKACNDERLAREKAEVLEKLQQIGLFKLFKGHFQGCEVRIIAA